MTLISYRNTEFLQVCLELTQQVEVLPGVIETGLCRRVWKTKSVAVGLTDTVAPTAGKQGGS